MTNECVNDECPSSPLASEFGLRGYFVLRHFVLVTIITTLKERAQIDGVILGGTELSLILRDETVFGIQLLDTTQIHVEAAVV